MNFSTLKKIAFVNTSVLKLLTFFFFFLIVARSSPYISLLGMHSSFSHAEDQSVKLYETK